MKQLFLIILFSSISVFPQTLTIFGKVTDAKTGEPLPYANIRVMNTLTGTAANTSGEYELKLQPGKYNLIASYIGFYSDTVFIDLVSASTEIDFELEQTELQLPEVVILPGENPALEIIRKAIKKKNERNEKLNSYEFEAYTKGSIKTVGDLVAGSNSIGVGAGTDTSKMRISGIIENQSKGYFKKPDYYKEIITARKQSANFPPMINTITGGRIIQNFYENDVRFLGRDIPGPLADDALDYYDYFLESTSSLDKQKVFVISMRTIDRDDAGFEGRIFITDSTFNLIKVDLILNRAANTGGIFDTVNVVQQFADYDGIYMPVDYHLLVNANVLGIARFGFEVNSVLYDYKINPQIDEDKFSRAIVTVLPDADEKDSLYWTKTTTIPNTPEEENAYKRIDSLVNVPLTFWDRFDILSDRIQLGDNFAISAPLAMYHFNRIEGHAIDYSFYVRNAANRRLNSTLDLSYGFSDKKFKTDFNFEYLFGKYRTYGFELSAFKKLNILFGESDNYGNLFATISSLFFKEDFRDYYYSKGFNAEVWGEVTDFLELSLGFINRTDKSAYQNSDFSFFFKDDKYRPNPEINEGKFNILKAGFKLDFRNYIEDGFFRRRTGMGRSHVLFSGEVLHSDNKTISSSLDFTTYKFRSRGFIRTFKSAYLNFRLFAMYNKGTLPFQDLYGLPGNIDYFSNDYTFRTLTINEIFGERVLTLNLEHQFRDELFKMLNIPGFKDWEITLNAFINMAIAKNGDKTKANLPAFIKEFPHPFYEIGFGLGQGIFPISLEFAWKLNYRGDNNFRFSLNMIVL